MKMNKVHNSEKHYPIKPGSFQSSDLFHLIRKNSFYMLLERSIVPLINFIVTVFIIRRLTIDDYGIYNILLALMSYISLFSSLGLPNIFQRYVPEFHQKGNIPELKKLIERGLLWRFLVTCITMLIFIVFSEYLGKLLNFQNAFKYFLIFSVAIIFYLESSLLSIFLTSIFHHKMYVKSQIIYVLFRSVLLFYLLSIGKQLKGLLIAESISYVFLFILQFYYYKKFIGVRISNKNVKLPIKRLLRFGGYSYFNEIGAEILSVSTDLIIISAFLGPLAVGIYSFANRLMMLISRILPQFMFMSIIRPVFFTKYVQNKDPEQIKKMFNFLMKIIAFVSFPLLMEIIIFGDKLIIYVFDPKYIKSMNVLYVVACFFTLNFFVRPIELVLQSIEKVNVLFYSKLFAIYNLIADFLIVRHFGIIGVAVVTGTAVLGKNIFCYLYAKKYVFLKLGLKSLMSIAINSIIMGLFLYALRNQVVNLMSFIFVTIIGGLIYILASYFNKAFSAQERNILNNILPIPIFVF